MLSSKSAAPAIMFMLCASPA